MRRDAENFSDCNVKISKILNDYNWILISEIEGSKLQIKQCY